MTLTQEQLDLLGQRAVETTQVCGQSTSYAVSETNWTNLLTLILALIVILLSLFILAKNNRQKIKEFFTDKEKSNYRWLSILILALIFIIMYFLFNSTTNFKNNIGSANFDFLHKRMTIHKYGNFEDEDSLEECYKKIDDKYRDLRNSN